MSILKNNPAILALFVSAKNDAEREVLAGTFSALGEPSAMLTEFGHLRAEAQRAESAARFGERLGKYSIPKSLLTLLSEAHGLGLGAVVFSGSPTGAPDPETGEPSLVFTAVLASGKSGKSGKSGGAKSVSFRGRAYAPSGVSEALKSIGERDPMFASAQLALAASGSGNIRKVFQSRGYTLSSGSLPSEKSNYNVWQALQALARLASGAEGDSLRLLKREFTWEF